jgi:uracil phosphoribosyltransferase
VQLDYVALPDVNDREMILIDPMMATGKSVVNAVQCLLKHGRPAHIHIAALVAAPEGIDFIRKNIKVSHTIYACALDENLNQQFYIVPGLGDAGDLSFGLKL